MFFKRNSNELVTLIVTVQLIIIISLFPSIPWVYAQSSVDGTLLINSGDQYATDTTVELTLTCSPGSGSYCLVAVVLDNIDANRDSDAVDTITGIEVSSTFPDKLLIEAEETGPNTGIFFFEFDNEVIESSGPTALSFDEGDVLTVENLPLSSDNGIKTITATFADGFTSTEATDSIVLDTIPPSTITDAISPSDNVFLNDSIPIFEWAESSDSNPITYELVADDDPSFFLPYVFSYIDITDSDYLPSSDLEDNTYFWRVRAIDAAGNSGLWSPSFTFTVDTIPPDAPVITSPESGSVIADSTPTISGISEEGAQIDLYIDGREVPSIFSSRGSEWSFTPSSPLDEGSHSITARAVDQADNISPISDVVDITVDSLAPSGSVDIGDPIIVDSNTPAVATLVLSCSDASGCSEMRIALDGNLDTERFEEYVPTKEVALSLGDGEKTIIVQFRDTAGNLSPIESNSISIRYSSPSIELVIIGTAFGGIGAAAIGYGVKTGKIKFKPKPTFRIKFEYGLQGENDDAQDEITSSASDSGEDAADGINKLQQEFGSSAEDMLGEVKQKLGQLKQVAEFAKLCRDAKQDPDEAISKVSDKLIENMLSYVKPYFARLFVEDISAQIKLKGLNDGEEEKSLTAKLDVDLKPIDPYVGLSVLVNEIEKFSIRFIFRLNSNANIHKLKIHTISTEDGRKSGTLRMDLQDVTISVKLSLLNVSVSYFDRPMLQKPIEIADREFAIKKLSLLKVPSEKGAIHISSGIAALGKGPVGGSITKIQQLCKKCSKAVASGKKFCTNCGEAVT